MNGMLDIKVDYFFCEPLWVWYCEGSPRGLGEESNAGGVWARESGWGEMNFLELWKATSSDLAWVAIQVNILISSKGGEGGKPYCKEFQILYFIKFNWPVWNKSFLSKF